MKIRSRNPVWAGVAASVLALSLQGCLGTSPTPPSASGPALNPHDEAARLIRTLDLSGYLQDSARDYVATEIARGVAPRSALQRWIGEQRDRGAVIRCRPQVSATEDCVART